MKLRSLDKYPSTQSIVDFLSSIYPNISTAGKQQSEISEVCPLDSEDAKLSSLSFVRAKDLSQALKAINTSKSGTFLIAGDPKGIPNNIEKFIICVPEPQIAYIQVLEKFFLDPEENLKPSGIHPSAVIDPTAKIAKDAVIAAYCVIGANCFVDSQAVLHPHVVLYHDVIIGAKSVVHAHAIIREHSKIGNNCCVQPGAVIGSDGFGYVADPKMGLRTVPQIGTVELSDGVDVGSNACIDRAAAGKTKIGLGTKLDNLVQIGHNVEIGKHSVICGQVGIGGSSQIGDGVVLAGQVGVGDHMKIASGVRVGGAGVVISHVEEPGDYMGYPVQPAFQWRRILAAQQRLPEMLRSFLKSIKS